MEEEGWSLAQFLTSFLVVTVIIGGSAASLTGRAIAQSWRPLWMALLAVLPLAGAVRFVDFVVFATDLGSPWLYLVDLAALLPAAAVGHAATRAGQMARSYPWAAERTGLLSWRMRSGD
ncbi:MAG: hypothetical protein U1E56_13915 [Bauldia sp.]